MTHANISNNYKPCRYGMTLHAMLPKIKSLNKEPVKVNGIQSTPSSRSDSAKLYNMVLVGVRVNLFCARVTNTRVLPTTDSKKMME